MSCENVTFHRAQRQAVTHRDGPMLALAGPGSGKTTVLTHRTRYLIEECGVNPSHILVITFTKAAAEEMKERFQKLMNGSTAAVSFGTFHAVFFHILRYAYGYGVQNIAREDQRVRLIRRLMDRFEVEAEDEAELSAALLTEISYVKSERIETDYYYSKNCPEEVFKQIYRGYEEELRKSRLLDFDDMLVMCHELFTERKDILSAWQQKYRYILVDEFQDINRTQYEVVRMLAAPENNLFIVGDDDQSIYRFRGARPEIMLGFQKDYPDAARVTLNVNYRSTDEIVEAAGRLIAHNSARFPKEIVSRKGRGKPVVSREWPTPREEAEAMAREFAAYARAGYSYRDIAVLFRTNLKTGILVEKLMEYNIPFWMKDAFPNIYEHWIARDLKAYIRMAGGEMDRAGVLCVINRPNRYISRDSLDAPAVSLEALKSFYQDKAWMVERIERLEYDLSMISRMAPAAAVNYIRKAVGYDDYIKEYAQRRGINPEDLYEILNQIQESASGFKTFADWFSHMEDYKKELERQAEKNRRSAEGVALMTMHASKGLEYKIVYIPGANEGTSPHRKAVLDADLEEERRMFYVAMTRASERLYVSWVKEKYGKKQEVSRFVSEYLGQDKPGNGKKTV